MSILAGPARTLHLPVTWYLREVEKTWRAHQALLHPSKLSPLWGQPAHCGEGVSRVRNKKTEVKISSGQRRAPGWPAEWQMGGEKVDDVPGKLTLFVPILGILPQPRSNVLLPAAGALGKILQLETATTKMFPPRTSKPHYCCPSSDSLSQGEVVIPLLWSNRSSRATKSHVLAGWPYVHLMAAWHPALDRAGFPSLLVCDFLSTTSQPSVAHTITSGKIKIALFNCSDISVNYKSVYEYKWL